jgi:hypothetical protein
MFTPTPVGTPTPQLSTTGWYGEYYDNASLLGQPVLTRQDTELEFDWILDSPAPNIPADNFSARWTRLFNFSVGGDYRFFAEVDDGVRVYVNDRLVIDGWHTFTPITYQGDLHDLPPGVHTVTVEYFESGSHARIKVWGEKTQLADPEWLAEYYPNPDLEEPAALIRKDENLDFDWDRDSPVAGLDKNYFSIRWRRTFFFHEGGNYKFSAEVADKDRVKIFLDGWLLVDEYKKEGGTVNGFFSELAPGFHTVTVEYHEKTGEAKIRVWWDRQ